MFKKNKKIKNFLIFIYRSLDFFICFILLKYIFKVKKVGKGCHFKKSFKIFAGAKNITIGNNVFLEGALLNAGNKNGFIKIEDCVFFGHRVMILARGHDYNKTLFGRQETITESPIVIKKGAWIGSGAIVLGGVTIGENSVIAAGSVVVKNVDDNSVFGGNPAKFIKKINT